MSGRELTVVGGGLAGLVAAVTAAEAGAGVRLFEAHARLGGRARSAREPYVANDGPHVLYADGAAWNWLTHRALSAPYRRLSPVAGMGFRFRRAGRRRVAPPAGLLRLLAGRSRTAPVDEDFRTWATRGYGEDVATAAAAFMAVVTYTPDPGGLSAAFVEERLRRVANPTGPRYLVGGWEALIARLERRARERGVRLETGQAVTTLPDGPVVVATSLAAARTLLGRPLPTPAIGGNAQLLDVAVRPRRGDAFIVSDLDTPGWVEAYSRVGAAPTAPGTVLVQAQRPPQGGEDRAAATRALEDLLDCGLPGWAERTTWRRTATAVGRTGALDLPGHTWRDRPAIDQGDGVFLAGDEVAAPGLLSEVSFASAVTAAMNAVTLPVRPPRAHA